MRLSSISTFQYKLMPLVVLWLMEASLIFDALTAGLVLLPFGVLATILLARRSSLKMVYAEEKHLRVRNFIQEIEVPYSEIADAQPLGFFSPRKILVTLKRPCRFGTKILFIPTLSVMPIAKHPTLELLRERAGLPSVPRPDPSGACP